MRPIFLSEITESKAEKSLQDQKEQVGKAIDSLAAYLLNDYWPETLSYSKHTLMGPVGKLLAVLTSGRMQEKEALLGYVANVHQNTSRRPLTPEGLRCLNEALDALVALRDGLSKRAWLKVLKDLDYAVFFKKYEQIAQRIEAKRERTEAIETFLEGQFGTVEKLKAAIPALVDVDDFHAAAGRIYEDEQLLPEDKRAALAEHLKHLESQKED